MNLVLLGGNSPHNKEWLNSLAAALRQDYSSIYAHHYRHWESGATLIDLDYELEALIKRLPRGPYVIIAKSAGVLLTLKGWAESLLAPQKNVFLGTPLYWAKDHGFSIETWLKDYSLPTLFIQQSYDPAMPFADLKQYLNNVRVKKHQLLEIEGDDHTYDNFAELRKNILSFASLSSK